jgi:tRNA-2-methylthio-N6-dimethylallyladenosine synthase
VQSGSDRILKAMNRGYTVAEYLETVDRAIERLPDVSIAGDIIVGFPTETDEDFEATERLMRRVPFKNNFIFKYSPRPGTTAFDRLPDDVPDEVKRYRNNRLLALQAEVSREVHAREVGRTLPVLFDRVGSIPLERRSDMTAAGSGGGVELRVSGRRATDDSMPRARGEASRQWQALGRTAGDLIVAVDVEDEIAAEAMRGRILEVEVTAAEALLLRGRRPMPAIAPIG